VNEILPNSFCAKFIGDYQDRGSTKLSGVDILLPWEEAVRVLHELSDKWTMEKKIELQHFMRSLISMMGMIDTYHGAIQKWVNGIKHFTIGPSRTGVFITMEKGITKPEGVQLLSTNNSKIFFITATVGTSSRSVTAHGPLSTPRNQEQIEELQAAMFSAANAMSFEMVLRNALHQFPLPGEETSMYSVNMFLVASAGEEFKWSQLSSRVKEISNSLEMNQSMALLRVMPSEQLIAEHDPAEIQLKNQLEAKTPTENQLETIISLENQLEVMITQDEGLYTGKPIMLRPAEDSTPMEDSPKSSSSDESDSSTDDGSSDDRTILLQEDQKDIIRIFTKETFFVKGGPAISSTITKSQARIALRMIYRKPGKLLRCVMEEPATEHTIFCKKLYEAKKKCDWLLEEEEPHWQMWEPAQWLLQHLLDSTAGCNCRCHSAIFEIANKMVDSTRFTMSQITYL
jgi:hypothetical protein